MMTLEWKKKRSEAGKKAANTRKRRKRAKKANETRGEEGRKAAAKKAVVGASCGTLLTSWTNFLSES